MTVFRCEFFISSLSLSIVLLLQLNKVAYMIKTDSEASDRPTADTLLRHSSFCVLDPYYNFYDTQLAEKLRTSSLSQGMENSQAAGA